MTATERKKLNGVIDEVTMAKRLLALDKNNASMVTQMLDNIETALLILWSSNQGE